LFPQNEEGEEGYVPEDDDGILFEGVSVVSGLRSSAHLRSAGTF
jgi:hypothetical protein